MSTGSEQFPIDQLPPGYGDPVNSGSPYQVNVVGQRPAVDGSTPPLPVQTGGETPVNGGSTMPDFSNIAGSLGLTPANANTLALAAAAWNDYHNAGKYTDMANKYANQMNPFDLAQRQAYQKRLTQSWDDPTAFLNDPAHKAIQERQMGILGAKLGAAGYSGSGKESSDIADYLATSDNQYLNDQRKMLADAAGVGINGSAAAGLIQTGIQGEIQSKNNALTNLTRALNPNGTVNPDGTTNMRNPAQSYAQQAAAKAAGIKVDPTGILRDATGQVIPNGTIVGGKDEYGNTVTYGPDGSQNGIIGKDGTFYNDNPTRDYGNGDISPQDIPGYNGGNSPIIGDVQPNVLDTGSLDFFFQGGGQ